MAVSYARSTYAKSKQFNEKLNKLQETIDPIVIRTYLANAGRPQNPNVEIPALKNLSDNEKAELEELRAIRTAGIKGEMQHAIAQAELNGLHLPASIVSGESIVPGFSQRTLAKVPSLGVYTLFMVYTEKELEKHIQQFEAEEPKVEPIQDDDQR